MSHLLLSNLDEYTRSHTSTKSRLTSPLIRFAHVEDQEVEVLLANNAHWRFSRGRSFTFDGTAKPWGPWYASRRGPKWTYMSCRDKSTQGHMDLADAIRSAEAYESLRAAGRDRPDESANAAGRHGGHA